MEDFVTLCFSEKNENNYCGYNMVYEFCFVFSSMKRLVHKCEVSLSSLLEVPDVGDRKGSVPANKLGLREINNRISHQVCSVLDEILKFL